MKRLFLFLTLWLVSLSSWADLPLPENAKTYLPLLQRTQADIWPEHPFPATMAAQVEKETCITLKHRTCWSPQAKLQTAREYGFGFGQLTVAYNADGTERFNTWDDLKKKHGALAKWKWEDRFDPEMQMKALVLYDRQIYKMFEQSSDDHMQVLMFSYAGYNGGPAGTLKEIRMCAATTGCNPKRWESKGGMIGVEQVSNKSRKPWNGYGDSAFSINRKYVKAIVYEKVGRYIPYYE